MPDRKTSEVSSTPSLYDGQTEATERALFSGLKNAGALPVDPGRPMDPPSRMLPVASFISVETNEASEVLGPIEQAMRKHPSLTRDGAEELLKAHGF